MQTLWVKVDHWGTIGLMKIVQTVIEHSQSIRKEVRSVGGGVSENTMCLVSSVKRHFGFQSSQQFAFPVVPFPSWLPSPSNFNYLEAAEWTRKVKSRLSFCDAPP